MLTHLSRVLPIADWGPHYQRRDLRSDLAAGLTIGAMLVPQAMAYALLAGLPPVVGLYAATIPVIVYALFGTSRQLAVGPVAIVSLLTATALAPLVEEGTAGYIAAAGLLALMVGVIHVFLGVFRLGFVVNFLSHAVLVGFTAAAAIIIGLSQVKHVLGVKIPRTEAFSENFVEIVKVVDETDGLTIAIGAGCLVALYTLKRFAPRLPGALIVVVIATAITYAFDLGARGVATVGEIPASLPAFSLPGWDTDLIGSLTSAAIIITIVGFMESVAVAKVYARRNRYDIVPNQEFIALGLANVAAGTFGGYPVTGGFSRTAVNANAGARTPLASLITAVVVLATLAFLTPLFESLPQAALGAIIIMAVVNLVDIAEMRHIAAVKRSDVIPMAIAFFATLALGIELGIAIAIVASIIVVFVRMSNPHTAVLGRIDGTTSYRNLLRFPEAITTPGIRVVRIDAAISYVNAAFVKRLVLQQASQIQSGQIQANQIESGQIQSGQTESGAGDGRRVLILDFSGVNDIDATGAGIMDEILDDLDDRGVVLYLSDVKGPVRDVLIRADLWDRLEGRISATTDAAVRAASGEMTASASLRAAGVDERERPQPPNIPPSM